MKQYSRQGTKANLQGKRSSLGHLPADHIVAVFDVVVGVVAAAAIAGVVVVDARITTLAVIASISERQVGEPRAQVSSHGSEGCGFKTGKEDGNRVTGRQAAQDIPGITFPSSCYYIPSQVFHVSPAPFF